MSASDDDKPLVDPALPDLSAQFAHLPVAPKPKRGRGRPRKVQPPAAAAAAVVPPPEPERVPTPPPCPHVTARRSPPLSVDSETDSDSGVDEKPQFVGGTKTDLDSELLQNIIDTQLEGIRVLHQENLQLRSRLAKVTSDPAPEDPDTTWDIYLIGAATGLAMGVMLRKVAAMLF